MEKKIVLYNTRIDIHGYEIGDCEELESSLCVWNQIYFRLEPRGLQYNEEKKILSVPRGIDVNFLVSKLKLPVFTDKNYNEYDKVNLKLKAEPRNDIQIKSLAFLTGEGKFKYTQEYSQLSLNLDTGDGKTYCVIASLCLHKMKAIIITHTENIKDQWKKSLIKFTNIDPRRICDLSGTKRMEDLLLEDSKDFDMYLVNHGTIQSYAKKHGWDNLNRFFEHTKVGIKVFDEAHLHFKSIINVDLNTNVHKTFYLTATFERTDKSEDRVFHLCFKNIAKYGYETRGEKRKHIKYVAVKFNSKPNMEDQMSIKTKMGFNRHAYMDYQLNKGIIFDVVKYVMDTFGKLEGKALVLSSKIESADKLKDMIDEWYPDKSIGIYHSKISKAEKEGIKEYDIISSTPQSCGTGFDVPGLRYNIMLEPYNATITANQVCGRLREIPDEFTYHIELIDVGFPKVKEMYRKRLKVFKEKCYSVSEVDY
jgi:superfamily II DNA or RNA helicase